MGPSANDFSNRRRPGRRGDGPARGPGGGPRDGARGRTGRGLNDPRRPAANTFRRMPPRGDGPGATGPGARTPGGKGPGSSEGRRWTRDRDEGSTAETWRRPDNAGQRPRPTEDRERPRWRMARRPEGPPARPIRPFRPARAEAPPLDSEQPRGDSHASAAPSELIWGRHAALAALESERPIHRIWCTPEMRFRPTFLQLLREAKASGVLVEEVTWARLGQISGGAVHQGIVLQPAAADTLDLASLIDGCRHLGESPLLVAVDGLTDPQNLGAILRSAEALGVHGLVLPQRRNAGLTGSVAKVAAGALEHLPVARVVNLNRSLDTLRQEGYRVVGLDPQGSVSLEEADLEGPLVVITGSEGQGLSVLTRRSCDQLVRIPLRGSTPSLNASVATALVLYEVARRGWMRGLRGMAKPPRLVRPQLATEARSDERAPGANPPEGSPQGAAPVGSPPPETLQPVAETLQTLQPEAEPPSPVPPLEGERQTLQPEARPLELPLPEPEPIALEQASPQPPPPQDEPVEPAEPEELLAHIPPEPVSERTPPSPAAPPVPAAPPAPSPAAPAETFAADIHL